MWHKPSLPLCWGITVTMNGSRVHSGMERNNAQRKLPVLVQLTTETFILLVIFFFLLLMYFQISCLQLLHSYAEMYSYFTCIQYVPFCLPWASVHFMDSFTCHFTSRVNKIHGLATRFGTHQIEWNRSTITLFQAFKGTTGVRARGE